MCFYNDSNSELLNLYPAPEFVLFVFIFTIDRNPWPGTDISLFFSYFDYRFCFIKDGASSDPINFLLYLL